MAADSTQIRALSGFLASPDRRGHVCEESRDVPKSSRTLNLLNFPSVGGDSRIGCGLIQDGKHMEVAGQTRRLLALAEIYDGGSRSDAARIGGVGLQIVRDWVCGSTPRVPDGLLNGKAPGAPSLLDDRQRQALRQVVEDGPIPAVHGVVRWRLIDLAQWLFEEFRVSNLQADAQPRTAEHGLSQALGAAAPSCARRGSRRGF